MPSIFREFLNKSGLSDDKIKEFEKEFAIVILLKILSETYEKLSTDDREKVKQLFDQRKMDEIIEFIEGKYPIEEWKQLLESKIAPIFESYIKEVVFGK
ncbi:MAG: hypothetical protein HY093_03685 [Candidatus Liptonbacteria bacterium]|nr:hypothetical protein [Candidatus Liptonbacteria bacterium]